MKYYNTDEKRIELKKRLEKRIYDFENPNSYKIDPLHSLEISELSPGESRKYGKFKIEKKEYKNNLYNTPIEHYIEHVIFQEIENKWEYVLSHTIYRWEKEIDHGKEYETIAAPLLPYIYVDPKERVFYVESEDATLYISLNLQNWFDWHVGPEKRPYKDAIDRLKKFKIPNDTDLKD